MLHFKINRNLGCINESRGNFVTGGLYMPEAALDRRGGSSGWRFTSASDSIKGTAHKSRTNIQLSKRESACQL